MGAGDKLGYSHLCLSTAFESLLTLGTAVVGASVSDEKSLSRAAGLTAGMAGKAATLS